MYAQKARHPNVAKKSSDTGASSQQRSPNLLCYIDESKTKPYFVYWKNDEMVLGVTDMGEDLFEAVLDRKERKKLLKNVAESIVDNKWRSTFSTKGFKLGNISEESVEIRYISETVELPRIESAAERCAKNAALMRNALAEIHELTNLSKSTGGSPTKNVVPAASQTQSQSHTVKRRLSPGPNAAVERNRRKRGKVTGVVFDDDEEDE
ncbi:hypothetical protein Ddc_04390 [Ditylenchus destructor]|nr:hypothetical protein Ddc_04390 [Ditylenchus destructor]